MARPKTQADNRSLSPDDAAHKLRNISLRGLDSISEGGRRTGPTAVPPSMLEVKSSVGVRYPFIHYQHHFDQPLPVALSVSGLVRTASH